MGRDTIQDRENRRADVRTVMNLRVPLNEGDSSTGREAGNVRRKTVFRGMSLTERIYFVNNRC